MLLYVFNGLVFLLLGLELRGGRRRIAERLVAASLRLYALVLWAALTLLRIALGLSRRATCRCSCSRRIREREGWRDPRGVFLVGWAGLRGSVTLAAALSIPLSTATARRFRGAT